MDESTLMIIRIVILAVVCIFFGGGIWCCVKYCKACAYYYYSPVNAVDSPLAFASVAVPSLCAGLIKGLLQSGSGIGVYCLVAMIGFAGLLAGIGLLVYCVRKIYLKCGSWKFAIATYPIEILIVCLGLFTAGLFLLGAHVVTKKITE